MTDSREFTDPRTGKLRRQCPSCGKWWPVDRQHFPRARDPRCTRCGAPHGTWNAYANWGCRCDDCRTAGRSYLASQYALPEHQTVWDGVGVKPLFYEYDPSRPYDEEDHRHGTWSAYRKGCRCIDCCNAAAGHRIRAKLGAPQPPADERETEYHFDIRRHGRKPRALRD